MKETLAVVGFGLSLMAAFALGAGIGMNTAGSDAVDRGFFQHQGKLYRVTPADLRP